MGMQRQFSARRLAPAALSTVAWLFAAAAHAEPFLSRNQNPLLAPFGLPDPLPARLPAAGTGDLAAVMNWVSFATDQTSGTSSFTQDGEVQEARLYGDYGIGRNFAVRAELAWRHLSGGVLDSFVDDWHKFWGLPKGDRASMPRNRLLIEYQVNEAVLLNVDRASSGIADIPLALGYQIEATDRLALAAWLTVKVPVGNAQDLTGSGATDVALSLAGQGPIADRWQWFGQIDAVRLGHGEILPQLQEDWVWSALAGVSWNAWRGLDLTVQFAGNSRAFNAPTNLAGDAVAVTFGGSYRTVAGWRFDLGIEEDIQVNHSPDIAFNFGVRRKF